LLIGLDERQASGYEILAGVDRKQVAEQPLEGAVAGGVVREGELAKLGLAAELVLVAFVVRRGISWNHKPAPRLSVGSRRRIAHV
jgi:hypothetical protein